MLGTRSNDSLTLPLNSGTVLALVHVPDRNSPGQSRKAHVMAFPPRNAAFSLLCQAKNDVQVLSRNVIPSRLKRPYTSTKPTSPIRRVLLLRSTCLSDIEKRRIFIDIAYSAARNHPRFLIPANFCCTRRGLLLCSGGIVRSCRKAGATAVRHSCAAVLPDQRCARSPERAIRPRVFS